MILMKMKHPFPKLDGKAILSPMAGVTDVAFRALAKKYGAALTFTEFVNSTAIVRGNEKTFDMVRVDESEKLAGVQLFGNNIEDIIYGAKNIQDQFDVIDINCGCPAYKVIKTGSGSALLQNPEKIKEIISRLVDELDKPVTAKIRSGINENNINAVEIAKAVEEAGASAITVHGRTQKQEYRGEADWEIIKKVKESVNIPVIGNGDVTTPEIFKKRLDESGVDYIMIARAAMGNPYLFRQINDYMKTGEYERKDGTEQFNEYLDNAEKYDISFIDIKAHAMQFTKGVKGGKSLRQMISETKHIDELMSIFS